MYIFYNWKGIFFIKIYSFNFTISKIKKKEVDEEVIELQRHIREVNELKSALMARIMQLDSLPLFFVGGREEQQSESGFNLSNPNSINPDNMSYEVRNIKKN